jgi:hypothetical protein
MNSYFQIVFTDYLVVFLLGLARNIEQCEENARSQKAALDTQMSRCAQLVAEAYDRYDPSLVAFSLPYKLL